MSRRRLRVSDFFHYVALFDRELIRVIAIARQALAQEDQMDFGNDFPETIPIHAEGERESCAC